jgi:hypothetical protein
MNDRFYFRQIIRLFSILLLGVLITLYFPTFEFVSSASLSSSTIVVILFVFLTGFLINRAIERIRSLNSSVSIELTRLRRIAHLVDNLPGRKKWKQSLHKAVVNYLETVAAKDFQDYKEAHHKFREITHEVYSFTPKTKKEELVLNELFEITRELAFERQQISNLIHSNISVYTKSAATFVAFIGIVQLLGARAEPETIFFIAGSVSSLLLILDIFFNLDILGKADRNQLSDKYKKNALDLSHE